MTIICVAVGLCYYTYIPDVSITAVKTITVVPQCTDETPPLIACEPQQ